MLSAAKRTNLKNIWHRNSPSWWYSLNRYTVLLLTHIDTHKNAITKVDRYFSVPETKDYAQFWERCHPETKK